MSSAFVSDPRRDAWKAIKGFYYQVQLTILRWLELQSGELLYCESGEDIDHIRAVVEADVGLQERLLEQVKVRSQITLRSPEAVGALARFCQATTNNPSTPSTRIFFRFSTTAGAGREKHAKFPRGLCGIKAWEAVRSNALTRDEALQVVDAVKALIGNRPRPGDLPKLVV